MCFDIEFRPRVTNETHPRARKEYRCCECRMPILQGEVYQSYWGVWEFGSETYRTCVFCEWLRERIVAAEMEHGCKAHESAPCFTELYEALREGHYQSIGMISLEMA